MLRVTGLSVSLGGREVVCGVDLEVAAGETTVILGNNGSGKSTTLRAVARLVPSVGEVLLEGVPLLRPDPRRIACLFQEAPIPFDLTVRELVSLGGPAVEEALQAVVLDGRRSLSTLSGGERQRAQLARCLAARPRLLIADEPTNHLDLLSKARLFEILTGRTALIATHDLELAARANRVVLLREGRVLAAGAPDVVLTPEGLGVALGVRLERLNHPTDGTSLFRLPMSARSLARPLARLDQPPLAGQTSQETTS